jgi:HAD superfamily hydrolase (TIGR01549 family)
MRIGVFALSHSRIKLVVFDVDGTLYRQGPVKRRMGLALLDGVARGHLTVDQVRLLRTYRRTRETVAERGGSPEDAVEATASALRCSRLDIVALEREWLLARPLAHLRAGSLPGVKELLDCLRDAGMSIIAWSDYPAHEKVEALGLDFDHVVCAADADVQALKPNPAGLLKAMACAGANASETLVVGDRDERDGAAARAAGAEYVVVEHGLDRDAIARVRRRISLCAKIEG